MAYDSNLVRQLLLLLFITVVSVQPARYHHNIPLNSCTNILWLKLENISILLSRGNRVDLSFVHSALTCLCLPSCSGIYLHSGALFNLTCALAGMPRGGGKGALCPGPQGLEGPFRFKLALFVCDVAISTANL